MPVPTRRVRRAARRPGGAGAAHVQRPAPGARRGGHLGARAEHPRLLRLRARVRARRRRRAALGRDRATCARRPTTSCGRGRGGRPDRRRWPLLRRLPHPRLPRLLPRPVRRGGRRLRDERPHHLLPRHGAVDRCRGGHEVRPPRARPGAARGDLAAARGRRDRRAGARRPRRARHERAAERGARRWSRRCGRRAARSTTSSSPGEGHEYRRADSRSGCCATVRFLTAHPPSDRAAAPSPELPLVATSCAQKSPRWQPAHSSSDRVYTASRWRIGCGSTCGSGPCASTRPARWRRPPARPVTSSVNGEKVKPSHVVRIGDEVRAQVAHEKILGVTACSMKRGERRRRRDARSRTGPRRLRRASRRPRRCCATWPPGRPTKRDRRAITRLRRLLTR